MNGSGPESVIDGRPHRALTREDIPRLTARARAAERDLHETSRRSLRASGYRSVAPTRSGASPARIGRTGPAAAAAGMSAYNRAAVAHVVPDALRDALRDVYGERRPRTDPQTFDAAAFRDALRPLRGRGPR